MSICRDILFSGLFRLRSRWAFSHILALSSAGYANLGVVNGAHGLCSRNAARFQNLRGRSAWCSAAVNAALCKLTQVGAAEGANMCGACPHADAAACTCGELHLLAALAPAAQWAGLAAIQLQRWAALRAARAAADPDPDQSQDGGAARQAAEWAGCTALAQVGPLLRVLARAAGNAAGSPAARDPRRQVRFHTGCFGDGQQRIQHSP